MEMLSFRIVLLASALTCMAVGKTYLEDPDIYYECERNKTIVIAVMTNVSYGSVHAEGTATNGTNITCSVEQSGKKPNVTFTIAKCTVTSTIRVYMMEEIQDRNEPVLGGKGLVVYDLMCNGIEKGGTNITKNFTLTDGDHVTVKAYLQKVVNLALEVKDNQTQTLTYDSQVRIGDELHLIVSGAVGFNFTAQSCQATNAKSIHKKNLTHDGLTFDPSLISNFSHQHNYTGHPGRVEIEATLYAFHFLDSDSIVIICTITVCESDDDSCHIKPNDGRRRRDTGVGPYTQSLQTTFRVVDNEHTVVTTNGGSESSITSGGSKLGLVLMLFYVMCGLFEFQA